MSFQRSIQNQRFARPEGRHRPRSVAADDFPVCPPAPKVASRAWACKLKWRGTSLATGILFLRVGALPTHILSGQNLNHNHAQVSTWGFTYAHV